MDVKHIIEKAEKAGRHIDNVYQVARQDATDLKKSGQTEFATEDRVFEFNPKIGPYGALVPVLKVEVKAKKPRAKKAKPVVKDLLMWVGSSNYPYIKDFVDEAARLGVSKRIGKVVRGTNPAKLGCSWPTTRVSKVRPSFSAISKLPESKFSFATANRTKFLKVQSQSI